MRIVWLLPIIGALFGGLTVLVTLSSGGGAPGQAAGYALACAFAVVPYVFARAVLGLYLPSQKEHTDRIVDAIHTNSAPHAPRDTEPASLARDLTR